MERDYENIHDIDDLSDDELRRLVRDTFDAQNAFDPADVTVSMRNGVVTIVGRVGTEVELRILERILADQIGLKQVDNQVFVDSLRRAESPEDVEEHLADEEAHEGLLLGDRAVPLSPEAEHLSEDFETEMYGTTDVQEAIEGAIPWTPPESPTPEGLEGR
jgi:hypothetical protein